MVGWHHRLNGHGFGWTSWWWTGRPGVLWFIGSQTVRPNWETEVNWTDAEAETPILWPPHAKSWLIGKDPDSGRDWGQEEKGMTEDEMAGWHHWLDGHESEWTLGVGDGQGGLACCDLWGHKESDMTEWLNWTEAYLTMEPFTTKHFQEWVFYKIHFGKFQSMLLNWAYV